MRHRIRNLGVTILGLAVLAPAALAIEVLTENTQVPPGTCQSFTFFRPLNVFKDPTLFLSDLSHVSSKNHEGWQQLARENPVLTELQGDVMLVLLGPPREFKNFGAIARVYEAAEPRLRWEEPKRDKKGHLLKNSNAQVIPIQVCGTDAYNSTLGFVLAEDFKKAQQYDTRRASLPPSIYPNPVPSLPSDTGSGR